MVTVRPCTEAAPVCVAAIGPVHAAPGALRAPPARIDWAELLKRIHDVDALACPCGGRLRFIALILEEQVARKVLDSLGLQSRAPPLDTARTDTPMLPATPASFRAPLLCGRLRPVGLDRSDR
jgi:hypothetical protein